MYAGFISGLHQFWEIFKYVIISVVSIFVFDEVGKGAFLNAVWPAAASLKNLDLLGYK